MTAAHAERAHATLAPSSSHRWMACPGSIRMASGIADSGSVFAAEGTAAHELAQHCMETGFDADRFAGWTFGAGKRVEHGKPDGKTTFKVTGEMVEGVQIYLDVMREIAGESDDFEIEQHMRMDDMVDGVGGTGDAIAYRGDLQRVTIGDLKYGKHVLVEVENNEQELTYAAMVAKRFHNRGVKEVELVIVQPRGRHPDGPVRRWVTDVITLYEHVAALQAAALAVDDPKSKLVVGDHCMFCKADGFCGALQDRVYEIIGAKLEKGTLMGLEQPEARPFKDWEAEQRELNMVAKWASQRELFAHAQAVAGSPPPGSKLVDKRAIRKWKDPELAAKTLVDAGVDVEDLYEPPSLLSPAQVEKVVGKKQKALLPDLVEKKSSGTVLAPLSDTRPAVDPSDSRGFEAMAVED